MTILAFSIVFPPLKLLKTPVPLDESWALSPEIKKAYV
jgi:hypothetical protein